MSVVEKSFDSWALVELFGHNKIIGRVTEASLAGGMFLRVDVPERKGNPAFTRYYGPAAIYSISPISAEVAISMMDAFRNEPISEFVFPQLSNEFIDKHVTEEA